MIGHGPGAQDLRPAIFFDCDGVLNEEPGGNGVLVPDDVRLIPGAGEAVRAARDAGYLAIVITNRAQVAKGFVKLAELDKIFARVEELLAQSGGTIDRIYFCPHHPDKTPGGVPELKIDCDCRKPGALLFRRAIADFAVDVRRSAVIGDSLRDIGAGRAVGLWTYGVRTGYACRDVARYPHREPPRPDLMFSDVREAIDFCVSYRRIAEPVLAALRQRQSNKPAIVAIAGRPHTGKSLLSHAVNRTLTEDGGRCLHVRLTGPAELLPGIVSDLREGRPATVSTYDPVTRQAGTAATHDPAGCAIILLDGDFAAHHSIRPMLDLAVFVDVPDEVQSARFGEFCRWMGMTDVAAEKLRASRAGEWRAIDLQRAEADLLLSGAPAA